MKEEVRLRVILKSLRKFNEFEDFLDLNKGKMILTARYIFNGADLREAINLAYEIGKKDAQDGDGE